MTSPVALAAFGIEADEHLRAVARILASADVETPPGDPALADALRRLHSLKGAAKLAGVGEVERVAHALESVLADASAGRLQLDPPIVDAALAAVDGMRDAVESATGGRESPSLEGEYAALVMIAAASEGADQELERRLPGLSAGDRGALMEYEKSNILRALDEGKRCCRIVAAEPSAAIAGRVRAIIGMLGAATRVVSVVCHAVVPAESIELHVIVTTRLDASERDQLGGQLGVRVMDLALRGTAASGEKAERLARHLERLAEQFVIERQEAIAEWPKLIMALEQSNDPRDAVSELLRHAHSLKGSAGSYGFPLLSTLSHGIETLLEAVRDGNVRMSGVVADALLRATDEMSRLLEEGRRQRSLPDRPLPITDELDRLVKPRQTPVRTVATRAKSPSGGSIAVERGDTIRVRLDKLDALVDVASELSLSRNRQETTGRRLEEQLATFRGLIELWHRVKRGAGGQETEALDGAVARFAESLEQMVHDFDDDTRQVARSVNRLQDGVLGVRMVPLSTLFDAAPRLVRDLTRERSKAVRVTVTGAELEVDKRVLEQMGDPLTHLLRNAVDHGIETTAEREAAGKPPQGRIDIAAEHRGSRIVITISDDGRGVDARRLADRAVERGFVGRDEAAAMTRPQQLALMFRQGLSTKDTVTEVSGRGVGMDVVRHHVERLKGSIEVDSEPGVGTRWRIALPLTIAINDVMFVDAAGEHLGLLTDGVREIVRVAPGDVRVQGGRSAIEYRGRIVPLVALASLLGRPAVTDADGVGYAAIVESMEGIAGFVVNRAFGQHAVLVKDLGDLHDRLPNVGGGTILADGRVSIILDPNALLHLALRPDAPQWKAAAPAPAKRAPRRRKVLVTDDSLTTRELLRALLETAGFDVMVARDGAEGLAMIERHAPELVMSDVQMPVMDGFGLVRAIRAHPRFSRLPVILLTALANEAEVRQGMEAGADAYLAKGAFDQGGLIARINDLLGTARE